MKTQEYIDSIRYALDSHFLPLKNKLFLSFEDKDITDNSNERILQIIWNEQALSTPLKMENGKIVEIISPGTWNLEEGPDFKNAAIKIDNKILTGTIEIHCNSSDWFKHNHHNDKNYDQVILHVVWNDDYKKKEHLPTCLSIKKHLSKSWQTIIKELKIDNYPYAKKVNLGSCSMKWASSNDQQIKKLLQVAGLARFEDKSRRIQRTILAKGADQALYEGIFQALGYKNNKQPFLQLTQALPIKKLQQMQPLVAEATLWGTAGLLPDPTTTNVHPELKEHLQKLWKEWWKLGKKNIKIKWSRKCRPYNTPERRLAAGIVLLNKYSFQPTKYIINNINNTNSEKELHKKLIEILQANSIWNQYAGFAHKIKQPASLLGQSRINDIIINIILPYLYIWSKQNKNIYTKNIQELFLNLPASQSNKLLNEATHRFFMPASRNKILLKKACMQQGLIEIYQNFCLFLCNDCKNCPLLLNFPVEDFQLRNKVYAD